jgi:hypothetical protein
VTVDPREWKTRHNLTINVGLGSGGKQEQLSGMMALIGLQSQALAAGKTNLVDDRNLYNSAKEVTKLLGKKSVDEFFKDPSDPQNPPPPPQEDPKITEIKMKAEIEKLQAQADIETNKQKTADETALTREKHQQELTQSREMHQAKMEEMRMGLVVKLAGSASKSSKVGPDGTVQESAPDTDTILAMIDKMNPKPVSMRMSKQPDGSWIKEPVQQ